MVSLHQTEELEVIWRKGDHDLGGQQLHHSERWLWEKWITWDLKPEEQDLKQCFISGRCLDQRAVNWGFFSLPQTFLLELPFTIRCFSGLFYFSDSTVQQSRQELDCRHGQHSPCSLEDRNNPLRLQMWHSQGATSDLTVPLHYYQEVELRIRIQVSVALVWGNMAQLLPQGVTLCISQILQRADETKVEALQRENKKCRSGSLWVNRLLINMFSAWMRGT